MSAAIAIQYEHSCLAAQKAVTRPAMMPAWLALTSIIVGLVFFAAGHDLFTSQAVAYTQTAEEMQAAALGGNLIRRVAFFVLSGWGLALLAMGRERFNVNWPLATALSALVCLAAASALWTEEPAMCLRRLLVLSCCLISAAGIARAFSLREMCWLVVIVAGSLATVGIAAEIAIGTFRPWANDYRFAGTVHPNTQGPTLATMCIALLALLKDSGRYRSLLWSIFVAVFVLLVLTKSRTAVAALLAAIAAIQVVKLPARTQMIGGLIAAWLSIAALCFIWICGFDPVADFRELVLLGRSNESESLSGRAFIWPEVFQYAHGRFWLGYGYEAFWTPSRIEAISQSLGWGLREAHNGYLEMWLWLGVVGVTLMLLAALAAIVTAVHNFYATDDGGYLLPIGLLAFGMFDSCLESGVVVISLVSFLLGCCVVRLALFAPAACNAVAPRSFAGSRCNSFNE